jgi:acyl-coenzyme A synthetase/AMP-(fatty) acid ligase
VWPVPVEDVVSTMDAVAEVAVWKRPDPEWGERVVAWVVLRPGAEAPALEQVRALVAAEVAPYAAPRELVVVDTLPRTPGGKVRRVDLV